MAMRLLVLALAVGLLAAADAEVRIRPSTQVAAPRATLGDIADLTGDAAVCERIRGITIAELTTLAPVPVDDRLVTALATRVAAPAVLAVSGAGTVQRQAATFLDAELYAAAAATVSGARTTPVRCSGAVTAPQGATLVAEVLDPQAVGEVAFRVRTMCDGRESGRALVVLRVDREVEVVVAVRDLPHGTAIGPGDVRRERRAATRVNQQAAIDPATLVGGVVRRDIAAGEIVAASLISAPMAVRAGATVTAVWPGHGFSVELQATALADARAGERVGVRRVGDRAVLTCVAQPDGSVLVQP